MSKLRSILHDHAVRVRSLNSPRAGACWIGLRRPGPTERSPRAHWAVTCKLWPPQLLRASMPRRRRRGVPKIRKRSPLPTAAARTSSPAPPSAACPCTCVLSVASPTVGGDQALAAAPARPRAVRALRCPLRVVLIRQPAGTKDFTLSREMTHFRIDLFSDLVSACRLGIAEKAEAAPMAAME
jgi:hypothetical protein